MWMQIPAAILSTVLLNAASTTATQKPTANADVRPPPPIGMTQEVVEGKVVESDKSCQTLTINGSAGTANVLIKPDTQVFVGKKKVSDPSAVPPGFFARAYFRNNGDAAYILTAKEPKLLPKTPPSL